ncbi:pectate lyase family protein [Salinactinospora qingdaonensis]|uniref:Pectate lyase n=1 Tax=Salinactinospora qingdaonensis TaxID=702744 RepID=A0ABP7FIK0_9ACTN
MRRTALITTVTGALLLSLAAPADAHGGHDDGPTWRAHWVARQTLDARDGWAAAQGGTTGGAAATRDNVHVVDDWDELRQALGGEDAGTNDTAKIIFIDGTVDANTDAEGNPLTCADYAAPGYDKQEYLATYDPEVRGDAEITGPLEEARERSADNQQQRVSMEVGANTTLIGLGDDARILGGALTLRDVDNVIVRNIEFEAPRDCFPHWEPGEWNSEYDGVTVRGSTHVWIDHATFSDGAHPDSENEYHWGYEYQTHDGLLDITNGSDLVTISYSRFSDHDKTMLIGSTDDPTLDRGKLRVTLHHNRFDNILQRAPRVRFGEVHVYNNLYVIPQPPETQKDYKYTWGVGVESKIYAENNYFDLDEEIAPAEIIHDWRGSDIYETHSLVNGRSPHHEVDLLAAYNAANAPDLGDDVGWQPRLHERVHPAAAVPGLVNAHAGTGRIL